MDRYTKTVLTVIAIGVVALNFRLWDVSLTTDAQAGNDIQKVEIVGPTHYPSGVKVYCTNCD